MPQPPIFFNPTFWLQRFLWYSVVLFSISTSSFAANSPSCVPELGSSSDALEISDCIQQIATWVDEIENSVTNVSTPNLVLTGFHRTDTQRWATAKDNSQTRLYREFVRFPEGVFGGATPIVSAGLVGFEVQGNIDLHVKVTEVAPSGFFLEIFGDDGMKYGHFEIQWMAISGNVIQVSEQTNKFVD